jgi:hypothetical protein
VRQVECTDSDSKKDTSELTAVGLRPERDEQGGADQAGRRQATPARARTKTPGQEIGDPASQRRANRYSQERQHRIESAGLQIQTTYILEVFEKPGEEDKCGIAECKIAGGDEENVPVSEDRAPTGRLSRRQAACGRRNASLDAA